MMLRLTSNLQSSCLSLLSAETTAVHHQNPLSFHYYKLGMLSLFMLVSKNRAVGRGDGIRNSFGKSALKSFVLPAFCLLLE